MLTSMSAGDKFTAVTSALTRKLTRLDDEAAEALNAIKNYVISTTMELYRPSDGGLLLLLLMRAQAGDANFTEIQNKDLTVYLESDALRCE